MTLLSNSPLGTIRGAVYEGFHCDRSPRSFNASLAVSQYGFTQHQRLNMGFVYPIIDHAESFIVGDEMKSRTDEFDNDSGPCRGPVGRHIDPNCHLKHHNF